ncbi:hypothetical protein [Paradevosia shaoguanensis]|uniref:hypothetical protein n=1 Tax=Paradevosia shaoguanensis TaxID=1335043 RepID=UPI003C736FD6
MKILSIMLCVSLVQIAMGSGGSAYAAVSMERHKCEAAGDLAYAIMEYRQQELPLSFVLDVAARGSARAAVEQLVLEAYRRDAHLSVARQELAAREFRNDVEFACYQQQSVASDEAALGGNRKPVALADKTEGWWVVLASEPLENNSVVTSAKRAVTVANAARCGFEVFNDFSAKFDGFRAGYNVYVVSPFGRKEDAAITADAVRPCIGDVYVKFADYAGE